MLPAWSTDSTMFSGFVSRTSLRSFGSSTGIEVVTTGIVIRKMISSTSITSTSGVVLIADTTSSSSAWPTFIAMASRPRCDLRARQQHRVQLGAEAAHLLHHRLVAADEPVVAQHRAHRHGKTEGRHDQRSTHRTRDLVNRGLARDTDGCQRVIDPPHGAEQSHERGRRADGREEREPVLRAALDVVDRALDRHADPFVHVDVAEEAGVAARGLEAGLGDEA